MASIHLEGAATTISMVDETLENPFLEAVLTEVGNGTPPTSNVFTPGPCSAMSIVAVAVPFDKGLEPLVVNTLLGHDVTRT